MARDLGATRERRNLDKSLFLMLLMQETNGQTASIQLEIKGIAVHAGLSVLLVCLKIGSVLPVMKLLT